MSLAAAQEAIATDWWTAYQTYIGAASAPAPVAPAPAPAAGAAGATALCKDGTYAFAAHHQGACSKHGGVSVFYHKHDSPAATYRTRRATASSSADTAACSSTITTGKSPVRCRVLADTPEKRRPRAATQTDALPQPRTRRLHGTTAHRITTRRQNAHGPSTHRARGVPPATGK
ncbi:MAG: DUF3761 domain-containing protein [Lacisediminihabitans sp.]